MFSQVTKYTVHYASLIIKFSLYLLALSGTQGITKSVFLFVSLSGKSLSPALNIRLTDKIFKHISPGQYSTLRTLIFGILHYFIDQTEPRILGLVVLHILESVREDGYL